MAAEANVDAYGFPFHDGETEFEDINASDRQIEAQREKWAEFIKSRGGIKPTEESWLWQYWKPESRKRSAITKKFLSVVGALGVPSQRLAQRTLKKLIRKGVPPELRAEVWFACSGASQKMASATPEDRYNSLVARFEAIKPGEPKYSVVDQIRRDLPRTFNENVKIKSDIGQDMLRRVLGAYSERNEVLGYCQSMNFIAAILLLVMGEERAFWVFCAIIEDILPEDYYTKSLTGSRVDCKVFDSCISWKLPEVYAHLRDTNAVLEPVTCSWFMCAFGSILPHRIVFRIWDCMLWEGNIAIIRAGIALVRLKAERICSCEDFMSIYMELKDISGNAAVIIPHSSHLTGSLGTVNEKFHEEFSDAQGVDAQNSSPRKLGIFEVLRKSESSPRSSELAFLEVSFHKRHCGSYPRSKISALRKEFRKFIESQDAVLSEKTLKDRIQRHSIKLSAAAVNHFIDDEEATTDASRFSSSTSTLHSNPDTVSISKDEGGGEDSDWEVVDHGASLRAIIADPQLDSLASYVSMKQSLAVSHEGSAEEIFSRVMAGSTEDDCSDDEDD